MYVCCNKELYAFNALRVRAWDVCTTGDEFAVLWRLEHACCVESTGRRQCESSQDSTNLMQSASSARKGGLACGRAIVRALQDSFHTAGTTRTGLPRRWFFFVLALTLGAKDTQAQTVLPVPQPGASLPHHHAAPCSRDRRGTLPLSSSCMSAVSDD